MKAKVSGYREVPKMAQLSINEPINDNYVCWQKHVNMFSEPAHRQYVQWYCKTVFEEVFCFTSQSIMFLANIEKLISSQDKS